MTDKPDAADITRKISESLAFRWLSILSVIGAIFGLALAVPEVRNRVFNEEPDLIVQLESAIPVLGINRQVTGLSVSYDGNNLLQNGKELNAIRVAIENVGRESITEADMSERDPLGFEVNGASIVRLNHFSASSDHLTNLAAPRLSENSVLIDSDIIIDGGDRLVFDLLLMADIDQEIRIVPVGKVAGISQIRFVDGSLSEERSIFEESWSGGLIVQVIRTISYFLLFFMIVAFVVTIGTQFSEVSQKRKRRKEVARTRTQLMLKGLRSDEAEFVLDTYLKHGPRVFPILDTAVRSTSKSIARSAENRSLNDDFGINMDEEKRLYLARERGMLFPGSIILAGAKRRGFMDDDDNLTDDFKGAFEAVKETLGEPSELEILRGKAIGK